jgi:hypothetical protein
MRREGKNTIRVLLKIIVERKRERRRHKKRWLITIENDMRAVGVCVGYVENQYE